MADKSNRTPSAPTKQPVPDTVLRAILPIERKGKATIQPGTIIYNCPKTAAQKLIDGGLADNVNTEGLICDW